jgi:hypothetical protein
MEHQPEVPQNVIDEYNDKLNKEIARLDEYRKSLQQEYEKKVIDEQSIRYHAMRVFSDSIQDVASQIVRIALTQDPEHVSPATALKASTYIYDRVIGSTDAPEEDDMQVLLERLKVPVESDDDIPFK